MSFIAGKLWIGVFGADRPLTQITQGGLVCAGPVCAGLRCDEEARGGGGGCNRLKRVDAAEETQEKWHKPGQSAQSPGGARPQRPRRQHGPGPCRVTEVYSRTRLGFGLKMSGQGHTALSC